MHLGSLFSGIGGLELGIERATGARTRWQVEIDPFCRRVLERHWPDAQRFDDVRTVGVHNLEPVDILCGGFPCQDLSVAGRGAGLDGERSGLFFEVVRIVREIRPRYVLLENVAALLARGLGRVLGELAACRYDARWGVFSAAGVGAPHLRERIFILAADAERGGLREQPVAITWSDGRTAAPGDGAARDASYANLQHLDLPQQPRHEDSDAAWACVDGETPDADRNDGGYEGRFDRTPSRDEGGRQRLPAFGDWCGWSPASAVRRVDDGIPKGLDRPRWRRPVNDKPRLRALGNAVVPQVAEQAWRTLMGAA